MLMKTADVGKSDIIRLPISNTYIYMICKLEKNSVVWPMLQAAES